MKEDEISDNLAKRIGRNIKHEIHLMYIVSLIVDAMMIDIEWKMRSVDRTLCLRHESKKRLKDWLKKVQDCKDNFETFVAPTIINSGSDDNYKDYERTRVLSQEIARLVMMYYENCASRENHAKVFDFIASLEGGERGVFTDEDVNRFNLGTK